MNAEEYIRMLKTYMAFRNPNLGDGGSILSLLYEAYSNANRMDDAQIKTDSYELYRLMNGMPLREMDWISIPSVPSVETMNTPGLCTGYRSAFG